jgi:hypothetical protein
MTLDSTPDPTVELARLRAAIAKHHAQRADDRCFLDDDELYAAAGLPVPDRRVGDKLAMLANCIRFIDRRCESGGPWRSYVELEAHLARVLDALRVYFFCPTQVAMSILHKVYLDLSSPNVSSSLPDASS